MKGLSLGEVRNIMTAEEKPKRLIPWQVVFIAMTIVTFLVLFTLWKGWEKENYEKLATSAFVALGSIGLLAIETAVILGFFKAAKANKPAVIASCFAAIAALAAIGVMGALLSGANAVKLETGTISKMTLIAGALLIFGVPIGSYSFSKGVAKKLKLSREITNMFLVAEIATIFLVINAIVVFSGLAISQ